MAHDVDPGALNAALNELSVLAARLRSERDEARRDAQAVRDHVVDSLAACIATERRQGWTNREQALWVATLMMGADTERMVCIALGEDVPEA